MKDLKKLFVKSFLIGFAGFIGICSSFAVNQFYAGEKLSSAKLNELFQTVVDTKNSLILDPNGVVITDGSGSMSTLNVKTELGYLVGATSNIQSQIDNIDKAKIGLGNVQNVDTTVPSNISQNSSYRFVTDAEKTSWNNKLSSFTETDPTAVKLTGNQTVAGVKTFVDSPSIQTSGNSYVEFKSTGTSNNIKAWAIGQGHNDGRLFMRMHGVGDALQIVPNSLDNPTDATVYTNRRVVSQGNFTVNSNSWQMIQLGDANTTNGQYFIGRGGNNSNPNMTLHIDGSNPSSEFKFMKSGGNTVMSIKNNGDTSFNGKEALRTSDTWLRLNQNGDFTSGVYTPGALRADGGIIDSSNRIRIDANGEWLRSYGNAGWYNGTYDGGWYMSDGTRIRTYNNKNVYTTGVIRADNGLIWANGNDGVKVKHDNVAGRGESFYKRASGDLFKFFNGPEGNSDPILTIGNDSVRILGNRGLQISGGSPSAGKVWTASDNNGNGSWQPMGGNKIAYASDVPTASSSNIRTYDSSVVNVGSVTIKNDGVYRLQVSVLGSGGSNRERASAVYRRNGVELFRTNCYSYSTDTSCFGGDGANKKVDVSLNKGDVITLTGYPGYEPTSTFNNRGVRISGWIGFTLKDPSDDIYWQ